MHALFSVWTFQPLKTFSRCDLLNLKLAETFPIMFASGFLRLFQTSRNFKLQTISSGFALQSFAIGYFRLARALSLLLRVRNSRVQPSSWRSCDYRERVALTVEPPYYFCGKIHESRRHEWNSRSSLQCRRFGSSDRKFATILEFAAILVWEKWVILTPTP